MKDAGAVKVAGTVKSGVAVLGRWLLDETSSVPPFEQIRVRILDLAASGKLAVGTRLPPVRTLAGQLGVAVNTVARAYRELEQAGIVRTGGRAGTVVAAAGDESLAQVAAAASDYAAVVNRHGVELGTALELVRAAVERSNAK
ncbi:GntR family transcriptional regulator [Arthrobacter sp. H14-L1]|uniref:GntR family transcriptional regulator n=1 Tax=Arthrobacter sp. H14-L1 TaxID=2996697 RepID=UPI00226EF877|nr:GntR family transcriptional regulator [Arthrobacter sp. H14-L1]MCY0905248.1 GntR family transcriptional regulator [Arthrobacter sp. H14-L1]